MAWGKRPTAISEEDRKTIRPQIGTEDLWKALRVAAEKFYGTSAQDPASRFGHGQALVSVEETKSVQDPASRFGHGQAIPGPTGRASDLASRGTTTGKTTAEAAGKPSSLRMAVEEIINRDLMSTRGEARSMERARDSVVPSGGVLGSPGNLGQKPAIPYAPTGSYTDASAVKDYYENEIGGTGLGTQEFLERAENLVGGGAASRFQEIMLSLSGTDGATLPPGHDDEVLALLAEIARRYEGGSVYQQYVGG